ncbi:DgyrCDS7615 [Dimorphilus gyrociliatus]|uniref:DgyrCDS7615 n=1 Tax=Dimorphilus gyrociliatus TaxID=2664684 RepID=A0A7I8VRP5_9ANNE|nr:DgyrCDS7615 [Dimorphilus gyrociliatus]
MSSLIGQRIRTRNNGVDSNRILMHDVTEKAFEEIEQDGFEEEIPGMSNSRNLTVNDQREFDELREIFNREYETLTDEFSETTIKLKEVEDHYTVAKDEVIQRRQEVLQAQIELDEISQHLDILKQETEILKTNHVDIQADNEGLRILSEVSKAWKEGLNGRDQLLNFDEILKDQLPRGQTVDRLLNERRVDLWSVFNPAISFEHQRQKANSKSNLKIRSTVRVQSTASKTNAPNKSQSRIIFND